MKLLRFSFRRAILLLPLIVTAALGQSPEPKSAQFRVAEMQGRVIDLLQLGPGATAADVGCGDGFYTIPLARRLGPKGKVFAVDIDPAALSKLRRRLRRDGLKNVRTIKGMEDNPRLKVASLDAALMVNAYHEMTKPEPMLRRTLAALKPGARVVLVERTSEVREKESREEQIKHHRLAARFAKQELEKAGFEIVEVHDPIMEGGPDLDENSRWWAIVARNPG